MSTSAYFAQDAMNERAVIKQLADYKETLAPESKDLYWAALIDSAFDYPVNDNALYLQNGINCYDFDRYQALKDAAPWLVPIQDDVQLRRIIKHCSGRPMLSFIASYEPLERLKATWEKVHWVHDADKTQMLLRIADTRSLPNIATILTPKQWAILTKLLAHWLYVNREGQLEALTLADITVEADDDITLSQTQLNAITDSAEPDAVIDFLVDGMSDIIPDTLERSAFYKLIEQSCTLAKQHNVDTFSDQISIAVSACLTKGESNQNPLLGALLAKKTWDSGKLGEMIIAEGLV